MTHLVLALAAFLQQTEPPPEPRIDRPRPFHNPPRDDSFFNLGPVMWEGIEFHGGWLEGRGLEVNLPDRVVAESQGFLPPYVVTLRYTDMDIEANQAGFTIDANLFRVSFDAMKGRWQGIGLLGINDGVHPATQSLIPMHGDFWGAKGELFWPTLRLRRGPFEACLGPEFSVAWYYEGLHHVPQSPLPIKDKSDEMVGGLGPKLSVRVIWNGFDLSVEGELPYLFGPVQGWSRQATAGLGIRF
ncbi:MAG TPA: hypothetical protein VEN81_16135 [Planctomycetota bacterium]|nr:hypothetical protein [Planctomycetota bacterium]